MPLYKHNQTLELEYGGRLERPTIAYQLQGTPKPDGSNVVWVSHALTANAEVTEWWPGLFGPNTLFDPEEWCIICANVLGSCYGSTQPLSVDPATGHPYYHEFPLLTIRDLVAAHRLLAAHLGIDRIGVLIGGSLGGQQAVEWSIIEPERFNNLVLIATNAEHSPWGVAFNESQRMAIENDPSWWQPDPDAGKEGMKTARSIALLSYRTYGAYHRSQQPEDTDPIWRHRAEGYQRYQGEKLAQRFNAYSYWYLSKAMDSHNVGRNRGGVELALSRVNARSLVISIESDTLFPVSEQERLAQHLPGAEHIVIPSNYGHDGFLIETPALSETIGGFLSNQLFESQQPELQQPTTCNEQLASSDWAQ